MVKHDGWTVALWFFLTSTMCVGPAAASTVYSVDLFSPGDGLLTRDPTLGLDWLDVDQTVGISAVDIQAGAGGWLALGFEYATTAEVCSLMAREAFPMTACGTISEETVPGDQAATLQALIGVTYETGGPTDPGGWVRRTEGVFDRGAFSSGQAGDARLQYTQGPDGPVSGKTDLIVNGGLSGGDVWDAGLSSPDVGTFLVRYIPVPEASSGTLLLAGLVAAAAITCRRAGPRAAPMPPLACSAARGSSDRA